jgi:hypothetical protein
MATRMRRDPGITVGEQVRRWRGWCISFREVVRVLSPGFENPEELRSYLQALVLRDWTSDARAPGILVWCGCSRDHGFLSFEGDLEDFDRLRERAEYRLEREHRGLVPGGGSPVVISDAITFHISTAQTMRTVEGIYRVAEEEARADPRVVALERRAHELLDAQPRSGPGPAAPVAVVRWHADYQRAVEERDQLRARVGRAARARLFRVSNRLVGL